MHPKPSFACLSSLNQSVNPRGLGTALSIRVNVNVGRVGIYSNFYFILFSLRDGGGCVGNVPLITPRAAVGGGTQPARSQGAAPRGRPRRRPRHRPRRRVPVSSLASGPGQLCPADGLQAQSCPCALWGPRPGPRGMHVGERFCHRPPLLGTLAGRPVQRPEPAGAWGRPPAQQNPPHATTPLPRYVLLSS